MSPHGLQSIVVQNIINFKILFLFLKFFLKTFKILLNRLSGHTVLTLRFEEPDASWQEVGNG